MQDHDHGAPREPHDQQPAADEHKTDQQPAADQHEAKDLPQSARHGRRNWTVAAAAAIAVLAAVAGVIATGGGTSARGGETATARQIDVLLAGIPQSGNSLGSPTAPVTLQYFGDLECSTARAFTLGALPFIVRDLVRPGKLRIEYRSLRTVSEPSVFDVQQAAALAAGRQDKLWYYVESFYHEQGPEHSGYVTASYLSNLAREVPGLNLERWTDNRRATALTAQVTSDEQAASTAQLHSTPSFLLGRTGSGVFHSLGQFPEEPVAMNVAVWRALNKGMGQILRG